MASIVTDDSKDVSMTILKENISQLEKQILTTAKAINELIKEEESILTNYKLSKTVKGAGMVLAVQMLLHSHYYTRFESSQQFFCY
jgi:hypothetical protein